MSWTHTAGVMTDEGGYSVSYKHLSSPLCLLGPPYADDHRRMGMLA